MPLKQIVLALALLCGLAAAQTPNATTHPPGTYTVAYDNFQRTDNSTLGPNWTPAPGSYWAVSSNQAIVPVNYQTPACPFVNDHLYPGEWCTNLYTGATLNNDQYVSVRAASWSTSGPGQAFGVRYKYYGTSPDGTGNPMISGIYISCNYNTGNTCPSFVLTVGPDVEGGVDSQIGFFTPATAAGPTDTVSLQVVGYPPVCTFYMNGVQVGSAVTIQNQDMFVKSGFGPYNSGYAGMGLEYSSGTAGLQAFDNVMQVGYGFTYFEMGNVGIQPPTSPLLVKVKIG